MIVSSNAMQVQHWSGMDSSQRERDSDAKPVPPDSSQGQLRIPTGRPEVCHGRRIQRVFAESYADTALTLDGQLQARAQFVVVVVAAVVVVVVVVAVVVVVVAVARGAAFVVSNAATLQMFEGAQSQKSAAVDGINEREFFKWVFV